MFPSLNDVYICSKNDENIINLTGEWKYLYVQKSVHFYNSSPVLKIYYSSQCVMKEDEVDGMNEPQKKKKREKGERSSEKTGAEKEKGRRRSNRKWRRYESKPSYLVARLMCQLLNILFEMFILLREVITCSGILWFVTEFVCLKKLLYSHVNTVFKLILCCIQDTVYNLHGYIYFYEHCSCLKKKHDV